VFSAKKWPFDEFFGEKLPTLLNLLDKNDNFFAQSFSEKMTIFAKSIGEKWPILDDFFGDKNGRLFTDLFGIDRRRLRFWREN
jgi:hypothetical protein